MRQTKLLLLLSSVALMAVSGCQGGVSASTEAIEGSARSIVGTRLVGAQGRTQSDQNKIDDTVTRLCATRVWNEDECLRHDEESRK